MAAALGTPVVTLFGPTDPRWTEIGFAGERQVSVPTFCQPCQLKVCPLDHRCMTRLTPATVLREIDSLLPGGARVPEQHPEHEAPSPVSHAATRHRSGLRNVPTPDLCRVAAWLTGHFGMTRGWGGRCFAWGGPRE